MNGTQNRRTSRHAGRVFLIALLVFHQPATTAVIVVSGGCTLADAITAANSDSAVGACTAGSGADQLELTADVTLTAALPGITSDVTVEGNDFTVERHAAAAAFRIFEVQAGALTLNSATVSNGDAGAGQGGGIYQSSYTELTLEDSTVSGNSAVAGGGIAGARYSSGTLTNSTVSGNVAANDGGGLFFDGGGLEVYSHTLVNSTLSGNMAADKGGGAYALYWHDLIVINSTVSGNTAGSVGGGLFLGFKGEVELVNSTLAGNSAATGGGIGGYPYFGPVATGTVFGDNSGGACSAFNPPFNDNGGNLDDDGTCAPGFGVLSGLDPTLADNGGPTRTHALLAGSSAIDASGDCGLATDQRGVARDDGACDSGSFELESTAATVGGSVTGMQARDVRCINATTGQSTRFTLTGESAWDCEAQGLTVGPGDVVRQQVLGRAVGGAGGSVVGLVRSGARCRNVTTGQSVPVPLSSDTWDCVAEGLVVSPGDRIEQRVSGTVP